MNIFLNVLAAALATMLISSCISGESRVTPSDPVRLNHLQFIGTHNSYHIAPDEAIFEVMEGERYNESDQWTAARLREALSFTHAPLDQQLDMGLRVLELDVRDDPKGGQFDDPSFLRAVAPDMAENLSPFDSNGDLAKPGLKVFHTAEMDFRSRCLRFIQCLEIIRNWSLRNPGHLPIFIEMESKQGTKPALSSSYEPAEVLPFTDATWLGVHQEILSVFERNSLFLPRDLRGDFTSVNEAVRHEGWPPVEDMRGKIIFLLLDDPAKQDAYAAAVESSEPILFVTRTVADPQTAWLMRPKPDRQTIRPLVEAGFLVYTRADAHTREARDMDYARADEAFASGAQLIATDYPVADPDISEYAVSFGGRYVRCNVIFRNGGCGYGAQSEMK